MARSKESLKRARDGFKQRNPQLSMYDGAKNRAKHKGISFELKLKDIIIPAFCPVLTDIPLFFTPGAVTDNTPSLDRFDNNQGYTKENTSVISFRANSLKKDATFQELIAVARYVMPRVVSEAKEGLMNNQGEQR
jgi:hypothetical protein